MNRPAWIAVLLGLAALAARGDIVQHRFPELIWVTYTNFDGSTVEFPSNFGDSWSTQWFTSVPATYNRQFLRDFDINLDGAVDFQFETGDWNGFGISPTNGAAVWAGQSGPFDVNTLAWPLSTNDLVGPDTLEGGFWDEDEIYGSGICLTRDVGSAGWLCRMDDAYIGLQFDIDGNTHYGWVNLVVPTGNSGHVLGFAYEDEPDTPIRIIPEPSTLGLFGLAALALALSRRSQR